MGVLFLRAAVGSFVMEEDGLCLLSYIPPPFLILFDGGCMDQLPAVLEAQHMLAWHVV